MAPLSQGGGASSCYARGFVYFQLVMLSALLCSFFVVTSHHFMESLVLSVSLTLPMGFKARVVPSLSAVACAE